MKHIFKIIFFLFAILIGVTSCRKESEDITELDTEETPSNNRITGDVANLIVRTTTKDGSRDNILDKASCLSTVLPVKVIVGAKEIEVNTEADFEIVEQEFDKLDTNDFSLDFVFPIKFILSNYSEVTITNESELQALVSSCVSSDMDVDIECIDFEYPITFSSFNTVTELFNTVRVINDKQHFELLSNIASNEIIGMNFPIKMIQSNGVSVTIGSVVDLENNLISAINACDEDDDNDFNDDDCNECTVDTLMAAFNSCNSGFIVDKLIQGGSNTTSRFEDVRFIFNEGGTLELRSITGTVEGTWSSTGTGNNIQFEMELLGEPNELFQYRLSDIRVVNEVMFIDLRLGSDRLQFACDIGSSLPPSTGTPSAFEEIVINNIWDFTLVEQNGIDNSVNFGGYALDFKIDKTFIADNGVEQVSGQWNLSEGSSFFDLNFDGSTVFSPLSGNEYLFEINAFVGVIELTKGGDFIRLVAR